MTRPLSLGLVGIGKIARDQHLPAIAANPSFRLAAAASREGRVEGIANFSSLDAMLDRCPDIDAVVLCTPPGGRYELARTALARGKHVLLEKPPCVSTLQLDHLTAMAAEVGRTLYSAWHSQHAKGVSIVAPLLSDRRLKRITVTWKEDVRRWHPGQEWIFDAEGFGVFDPGINALSILTRIVAEKFHPTAARLQVPANRQAPIAADVVFTGVDGLEISAAFDFRETGRQIWEIEIETDRGMLKLSAGGAELAIDGVEVSGDPTSLADEYPAIYRDFALAITEGRIDVDPWPLRLVADIQLIAQRVLVEPFDA